MNSRITVSHKNGNTLFYFEQISIISRIKDFSCSVKEYNDYLYNDALRSKDDHIALTWLLKERSTESVSAYMSLISDAIKLSVSEKDLHNLNYPFKTIPAIKVAKLAVSQLSQKKYRGLGTYMINKAMALARICNRQLFACRFMTVDADIEHDEGILAFYEKNGFILNSEIYNRNRKTVSMRKDIYN